MFTLALGIGGDTTAWAHPGSGIVVDRQGQVYFTDTGHGVWRIDEQGRLSPHEGPAYHWMAIDHDGRLARTRWPASRELSTDIQRIGTNPTLLLSSDYPLTTGPDGSLYYPELGEDDVLRVYRLAPSGENRVLATLATTCDGQPLKWLNGMAAHADGVIYFSENTAVRRITPQGEVLTVASNIVVDDCQAPPGANPRLGPFLRGLEVAPDGSVYVAANGCCALLRIDLHGQVTPVLRSISPWSPTGVALRGKEVLVLEYLHTTAGDRREWTPRVRKLSPDGTATVVAAVERIHGGGSRPTGFRICDLLFGTGDWRLAVCDSSTAAGGDPRCGHDSQHHRSDGRSAGGLGDKSLVILSHSSKFRYDPLQTDLKRLPSNRALKQSRDGGHYLHAEDPELVIEGIRQALAAVNPQTKRTRRS